MNISFIGAGKLGLPLASLIAENNKVLLIDKNQTLINNLKEKRFNFNEKDLNIYIKKNYDNFLDFTSSYEKIFSQTSETIILVNTQLGEDGYSDEIVIDVFNEICEHFKTFQGEPHHFILSSTVLPGTIDRIINLLEEKTFKKYQKDFHFSYVPDFVKLGSVIHDFKYPEFFLVGSDSDEAFKRCLLAWHKVHQNNPPIRNLSLVETEIAKVSLNAYIVNKISFANHIQLISSSLGANPKNITDVIGLDSRIGNKFFNPGTPYGGTCFPRDAVAFEKFSQKQGFEALNMTFSSKVNEEILNLIYSKINSASSVLILGISFKQDTDVTVGSPSLNLIDKLLSDEKKVFFYDFMVTSLDEDRYSSLSTSKDIEELIDSSEAVVIMHPDQRFKSLNFKEKIVVDPWGITLN